ncbi:amidohydrolase family protein [Nakamurella endophytica]|uniref:Xaa-Pro dipeptidase n=1 Tax=Nakamurella endophytica TaxID=1748367 RepID=A0A917WJC3_9ACTN|nr:amidohydrolase family protein [Nakamurella endophytica]GGM08239.1 Xaa-Pro dipeptidase [Nakamurella endophytica]
MHATPTAGSADGAAPSTVWRGARLAGGAAPGADAQADAVWVTGGRIAAVGSADRVLDQAREAGPATVVDLDGAVLAPGLVNMHVHLGLGLPGPMADALHAANLAELVLLMADAARRTLHAGVTTARLVGESRYADMALRRAIDTGAVPGPHLVTAGHALCCTGGHGHDADGMEADGADGFRRATREQLRAGADLIKVCISGGIAGEHEAIDTPQLTDEEMAAVLSVAHDWGRLVTAHAGPADAIQRAVRLGLDGVEHGYRMDRATTDLLAEHGVWYVPTITVSRCEEFFDLHRVPRWMKERALAAGPDHWQSLQNAIASGVPIAMGSDMPPFAPFDGTTATVREMEFMVEAGMSDAAVFAAATSEAARYLGTPDELGSLVPGARADLLVLDGDPAADVSALRGLHAVLKNGDIVRDDRHLAARAVAA